MSHFKKFEPLRIQLVAIKSATNNFSDESCIGRGGFGKVYKGKISFFGGQVMVALKRLDRESDQGDPEFWKEIMMLSLYKHKNIVSLIGFCDDHGEKILVYEYVPNRSLDFHLKSDKLTWILRLKICIGAARGLSCLHSVVESQPRLFHCDIKSPNILLDEDMNAKISDFGLSKFCPVNQEWFFTNAVGTRGYCDPLYAENGYLTKESDVYSFGVVLFEVLCGRFCIDLKNVNPSLVELVQKSYEPNTIDEIVYNKIKDEINPESLQVFAKIAYKCLKIDRQERPLMTDIVRELEIALGYQELRYDPIASTFLPPEISELTESDHVASSYLPPKPSKVMESDHVTSSYLPSKPSEVMESDHWKAAKPESINEYASEYGGLLVVTIHEGNYLSGTKTSVSLRIGYDVRSTTKVEKNQYPIWNETFKFTLKKPAKTILHLGLISHPPWYSRTNVEDNLGILDISVAEVVKEKHIDKMYDIGNSKIHVELQWEPSELPVKTKPKVLQLIGSFYNYSYRRGS